MPRQSRIDYLGAFHHVIGRGIERRKIFETDRDKSLFFERIVTQLTRSSLQIYAWCIMDNHFHILIQTGETRLAEFMRCVLTGYAVNYNKIHKRTGHLFQNRYKSILCDKDEYLLPLIRYIHLNPVKAKIVEVKGLGAYRWTGHKEIIKKEAGLINREEVLGYFGKNEKQAVESYEEYILNGVNEEKDYEGGGLVRSAGGIDELLKGDSIREKEMYDDRILGGGGFVNEILEKVEKSEESRIVSIQGLDDLIKGLARYYELDGQEIKKTRLKKVREARQVFIYLGFEHLKKTVTELGRYLGISQTAASKAMALGREVEIKKNVFQAIVESS
jgi:putative transposase